MARSERKSFDYAWKTFVAGGIAGCAAKSLVAPLDRVKLLFQTSSPQYQKYSGSFTGIFKTVGDIYQHRGVNGLFQGHSVTLLRIFPYAAIKFAAFEQYKRIFIPSPEYATRLRLTAVGSLAGVTSVFMVYPLELLRVRLAFSSNPQGMLSLLREIYHDAPIVQVKRTTSLIHLSNFYRGFAPTLYGIIPYAGVSFMVFERLKAFIKRDMPEWSPTTVHLVAGGLAGTTGQTVSYPLEVVRRRMQVSGARHTSIVNSIAPSTTISTDPVTVTTKASTVTTQQQVYRNTWSTAQHIWRQSGWRGFFVGLSIGYLKVTPMSMVSFWTYESCKRWLGVHDV